VHHRQFRAESHLQVANTGEFETGMVLMQKEGAAMGILLKSTPTQRYLMVSEWHGLQRIDGPHQSFRGTNIEWRVDARDLTVQWSARWNGQWHSIGPAKDISWLSPARLQGFNYTGMVLGIYGQTLASDASTDVYIQSVNYRGITR
jgi:hypothetical protein